MPITLIGTRIEVEYQVGDPKGNSYYSPWTMDDIKAASDAGGWSPPVVKNGYSYYVPYSILLKGVDTWFVASYASEDWDTVIFFEPTTLNETYCFHNNGEAHIRFGNNYRNSKPGVNIFISEAVEDNKQSIQLSGDLLLYNCKISRARFISINGNDTYIAYIDNCILQNAYWGLNYNNRTSINKLTIYGQYYQLKANLAPYFSSYITLIGGTLPIISDGYINNDPQIHKNIKILEITGTNNTLIRVIGTNADKKIYFIDSEIEFDKMVFYYSSTSYNNAKATQYLQTSLNVEILDENDDPIDCSIKVYSSNGTLLYSGDLVGGVLEDYVLTYAYKWMRVHLGAVESEDINHQPLKVEIYKEGYETLFINNINIDKGVKTYIRGTLISEAIKLSGLTDNLESEVLRNLFLKEPVPGMGDYLYIALLKESPGEVGSILNEATYTGYGRVAVPRGESGWDENLGTVRNKNQINFGECMGNPETIKYCAVMKENTGENMMCYGELYEPMEVLETHQPQFGPYKLQMKLN